MGAIIDALDIASFAANLFSGGRVEIDYKIEVRFSAEIRLVGKKIKEAEDGEPAVFEPEATFKCNFADKELDFYGGIEGKIIGEIEISTSVRFMAKKEVISSPENDKSKIAELGIGVECSSYVKVSCPFDLNKDGNLDVNFFFSGVKLKTWTKASMNTRNRDGKPDIEINLIRFIDEIQTINF